jgi:hypothetical protein
MDKPTVDEIRLWSRVKFAREGYADDEKLANVIDRSAAYVSWVTGQRVDAVTLDASMSPTGSPLDLEPIMDQAIQMRVEQVVLQGRTGYLGSAAEMDVIQSFSAGGYSEQRARGGFASRTGAAEKSINKWPSLEELLWMLMTEERFAFWLAFVSGQPLASFWVEEIDWRQAGTGVTFFEPWDRYVLAPESSMV